MQDSQQILNNVKEIQSNKYIDTDQKLVLFYLKTYEGLRMDSKYASIQDLLNIDINLVQQIIDAKHIIDLLEDE